MRVRWELLNYLGCGILDDFRARDSIGICNHQLNMT